MDRLENLFGAQASKMSYLYSLKHGGKAAKKDAEEKKEFPKFRVSKAAGRVVYDENKKPVKVPKDITEDQAAGRTPFTASNGKKYYLSGDSKSCASVDYTRKRNLKAAKKAVDKIDFAKEGEELPSTTAVYVPGVQLDPKMSDYLKKDSNKSSNSSDESSSSSSSGDGYENFHPMSESSDSSDLSYSSGSSSSSSSTGTVSGKATDNASFISSMNDAYTEAGISNPDLRRLLISQDALETGYGTKLAGNYNYGNITAGSSWTGDVVVAYDKGDKTNHAFRSYDSAEEFARDKVALLTRRYHVNNSDSPEVALAKIDGDNPGGYRYATDPQYAQSVSSVYQSLG